MSEPDGVSVQRISQELAAYGFSAIVFCSSISSAEERLGRPVPVQQQGRPCLTIEQSAFHEKRNFETLNLSVAFVASRISPNTSSHKLHISVGSRSKTSCVPVDTRLAIPIAVSFLCLGSDILSNYE